ncbi:hypothetical protein OUZ56_027939 [Daphnia magna]|uniref:Uncharacterized protein n=1 Tax=Daphnia magna TaxID=35525 RepID=A0ABR0B2D5_9CRUS|nr:hypothetical protein OUZ56_027939 [Daphnia magna]
MMKADDTGVWSSDRTTTASKLKITLELCPALNPRSALRGHCTMANACSRVEAPLSSLAFPAFFFQEDAIFEMPSSGQN